MTKKNKITTNMKLIIAIILIKFVFLQINGVDKKSNNTKVEEDLLDNIIKEIDKIDLSEVVFDENNIIKLENEEDDDNDDDIIKIIESFQEDLDHLTDEGIINDDDLFDIKFPVEDELTFAKKQIPKIII